MPEAPRFVAAITQTINIASYLATYTYGSVSPFELEVHGVPFHTSFENLFELG